MNFLSIFKKNKVKPIDPDTKNRVLKNRETALDIIGEKMEGNKMCPYMLGQPCLSDFCMKFMRFDSENEKGEKTEFWNCSDVQTPLLLIELNRNIRTLTDAVKGGRKNEQPN